MIPNPPSIYLLPAGYQLNAGLEKSTIIADFDFETYSPAGFVWDEKLNKFKPPKGSKDKGLFCVGAAVYTEHPDCEVLSLAYNLKNGTGPKLWQPGLPDPIDLFEHVRSRYLLEAWNCSFEYWVWQNVCVPKYGFPSLNIDQLRCAMAKSRAFALPGSLDKAGQVLNISAKKDKEGKRLLNKFSIPRDPTKKDLSKRILPSQDPEDALNLYRYNLRDIEAEAEISSLVPDLSPFELEFWKCDQRINSRGVQVDLVNIKNCIAVIEQAYDKYNHELRILTQNSVQAASEIQKLKNWIETQGVRTDSLNEDSINTLLNSSLPTNVRRVLEIRQLIGSASVKKLYSMFNQATKKGRLHDLFIYHSARTGRAAGTGPQPQNLPNSGPDLSQCNNTTCGNHHHILQKSCPWCGKDASQSKKVEWNPEAVNQAIETIRTQSLEWVEHFWGDAVEIVSSCLRGLFISKDGYDLICSDYSAIEAVVLAALAGEEWRLEVFRTHGKIYEMSASKITGVAFEDFIKHKEETGQHHPLRKKVGKVAELASGYQGWIGAWKQFGADKFFTEDEMKTAILAWRAASPRIVEMWGGQSKPWRNEYFGLEGAAIQAVLNPGVPFEFRGITYLTYNDILYCTLLSGRKLIYHRPRLENDNERGGFKLSFEGYNSNPKNGPTGWLRMYTYGGKLTENVVQATSRDILANAIVNLEKAGYPVVLHVHDEICCEVKENFGSIEELESIMCTLPSWAKNWPIRAIGGWRGKRYRK